MFTDLTVGGIKNMKDKKIHFESLKMDGFVDIGAIFDGTGHLSSEAKETITKGRGNLDPVVVKKIDQHSWCEKCNQELEELKKTNEVYKDQDLPM